MPQNKMAMVKWLLVLATAGLTAACFSFPSANNNPPAPPPESYVQDPVRSTRLGTRISWTLEYQAADSNAAIVWANETAPKAMIDALGELGVDDGNTFVDPEQGQNPQLIIYVHQYGNGQSGADWAASLMAEFYALGHRDMVARIRTDSYHNEYDAISDLARRLYGWLHGGWHTIDRGA